MENKKIKNNLKMEIYSKGGSSMYCDYYFYNGISSERGTTRANGYGYDKESTALSNAINKYKNLYKFRNGLKWDDMEHVATKENKRIYGICKDKTISYGIGISSALNCLNAFSNVKIKYVNYGLKTTFIHIEITTTKKQIEKEIAKNQKKIDNKKATKEDKKTAKSNIEKIKKLFDM